MYTFAASAPGFRPQVTNVNSSVGQTTAITVKIELGDVNQQVKVSADADVLNTSDSSISSVIGETLVQNLPSCASNIPTSLC